MLGTIMVFLRNRLDGYVSTRLGVAPGGAEQPVVVLLDEERTDPLAFPSWEQSRCS